MGYKKPPGISDKEWESTPPAVQTLLAQSILQFQQLQTASTPPSLEGDGATMFMPNAAPDDDDGGTVAMPPLEITSTEDDGATLYSPNVAPDDDDGGTVAMPLPEGDSTEDDGATLYSPSAAPDDDDGGTVAMTPPEITSTEDDGATLYSPNAAPDDDDGGGTAAMPVTPPDDGATAYMPLSHSPPDDGGTRPMSGATGPDRGHPNVCRTAKKTIRLTQQTDALWEQNIILQERYRLRTILGKGGFGAAYLAEDIKLKRGCVVKQMLNPKGVSAQEVEMNRANFEREASLLVQLNHPGHPNIPEIFDYFSDKSGSYLVMKYIEGQSLKGLMAQSQKKIPWQESVRYTIDVCNALNYMHTHGQEPVLHRDIKPANILHGDDGRIWLVDFGLAQVKPVESTSELSQAQAAGSVGYTPLEQWLGESIPVSDVYATGVTLHHLVTGENPLEAYREEDGHVKVNIEKLRDLHGQLDPIRKLNRKLPKALEEIINQAITPEPDQRLTALQLQQQLEVLISGAKDAALFTFKNGQSAHTISELVDLCEQNRVEAQGYLYRGDFERWFTLINRNDLAEAAVKAVKQGEKGKDGLEKFLKLIMPNIFLRRMWKASKNVARVGGALLLVFVVAALIVIAAATLGTRWLIQRTLANYNWNYYALTIDEPNIFSDTYLTKNAEKLTQAYLEDIQIDLQESGTVTINATLGSIASINVPVGLRMENNIPQISVTQINEVPLYWITDNLTEGVNQGIIQALQKAPINITSVKANNNEVIVEVEKSKQMAWNPPTPVPNATPTNTPTPIPTATPIGEALLAVFNDLDKDLSIEINGERWIVQANDNKVIERKPGSYTYVITYAENGQLAAQGTKTWTYRAYKWRIGLDGETFE